MPPDRKQPHRPPRDDPRTWRRSPERERRRAPPPPPPTLPSDDRDSRRFPRPRPSLGARYGRHSPPPPPPPPTMDWADNWLRLNLPPPPPPPQRPAPETQTDGIGAAAAGAEDGRDLSKKTKRRRTRAERTAAHPGRRQENRDKRTAATITAIEMRRDPATHSQVIDADLPPNLRGTLPLTGDKYGGTLKNTERNRQVMKQNDHVDIGREENRPTADRGRMHDYWVPDYASAPRPRPRSPSHRRSSYRSRTPPRFNRQFN